LEIAGTIDFELINVLPQFHAFMEDRADCEVEEPFLSMKGPCPHVPKNRMAPFFEKVEKALTPIIYPILNIRELEATFLELLEDFLKGNLGLKESLDHF
jgi:hypothetical protein